VARLFPVNTLIADYGPPPPAVPINWDASAEQRDLFVAKLNDNRDNSGRFH
jgi:hypothetical protein